MAVKKNTKKPKRTGRIKTSGVRRHRYGPIVAVIFLVLIAAAIFVGYKVIRSFDEPLLKKSDDTTQNTDAEKSKKSTETKSQETTQEKNDEAESISEEGKNNTKYEGGSANNAASLTGIVNYVGVSDGSFMVRVAIDQTVSSGTCDFAITSRSNKVYNYSVNTTVGPSSTYCGLNVPFSNLNSESGTWKVSVTIKSNNGKSGIITGEGTI